MSDDLRKPHHPYHHGNLRETVLAVARRAIDQGAYETLSLRELAKQAGVSTNAPYRHFASKSEILAEVAASGFRELTARFDNFLEADPKQRLIGLCDVYTDFAVSCPHLYRVMFGLERPGVWAFTDYPALKTAANDGFDRLLAATAAACAPAQLDSVELYKRANAIWSVVHGWSRLTIDGMLAFQPHGALAPASTIAAPIITSW
ncbi:MAG: TetR/AcrR family transcriptional regulator [Pseudomonadales bacterium]